MNGFKNLGGASLVALLPVLTCGSARAEVVQLEPERIIPITASDSNRAVRLSLHSIARTNSWLGSAAPRGNEFVVLHTLWENILSPATVRTHQLPVAYTIPSLRDHVYCILNGSQLLSLANVGGPGMLRAGALRLAAPGSIQLGRIVFQIPAASEIQALELRVYDFAHGPMSLPLVGTAVGADGPGPVSPPQRNEIIEVGVFGVEALPELDGKTAPPGMEFVRLDLRARSLLEVEADATAFDPSVSAGTRITVQTMTDWADWKKHVAVLVDGEYAYPPHAATRLPKKIRLLPDRMTGGALYALVPKVRSSLALQCEFPNAHVVSTTTALRPAGLQLAIDGEPPEFPDAPPLAAIEDDNFRISILREEVTDELPGRKTPVRTRYLSVDVTIENTGEYGEFFQPVRQLSFLNEHGRESGMLSGRLSTPHAPPDLLWIPSRSRRRFRAMYGISDKTTTRRLTYRGTTLAEVLTLDTGATEVAAPIVAVDPASKTPTETVAETGDETRTPAPAAPQTELVPLKSRASKLGPRLVRVTARQEREPKGLAGVGLTAEQVNLAIDKGRKFLWDWLQKDLKEKKRSLGAGRRDVLVALALVHSDAHREFPEFDVALREYLRGLTTRQLQRTYGAGIFCMLVEAYGDHTFAPKLEFAARYLLESQGPEGSWPYSTTIPDQLFQAGRLDQVLEVQGGRPLDGSRDDNRGWKRILPWEQGKDGDNSIAQYAMLGLHTASRLGIKFPDQLWQQAIGAYAVRQTNTGGWTYRSRRNAAYGSMTCAGICSRAIGRHQLGVPKPLEDESLELGLGWLEQNFTVTGNPPSQHWHYYYLYSVERVGRILDTEFIGKHEWYPMGARYLVNVQQDDGSWQGTQQEYAKELATSFALLFLTRATPSLAPAAPKRGGKGVVQTRAAAPIRNRLYIVLDASGSMRGKIDEQPKFEIAQEVVSELVQALPGKTKFGLRVYGHRRRATEKNANEDTENVIPVNTLRREKALETIAALRPRGKTPIALSLLEARKDLSVGPRSSKDPTTVVLLTDGGEDTRPRGNPVEAAQKLGALDNVELYIIGFDIGRPAWSKQLHEMAQASGGLYVPADKSEALHDHLLSVVFRRPQSYRLVDSFGKSVKTVPFGDSITLPEGKYLFVTQYGGKEFTSDLWVNTDETTAVLFNADNAKARQE